MNIVNNKEMGNYYINGHTDKLEFHGCNVYVAGHTDQLTCNSCNVYNTGHVDILKNNDGSKVEYRDRVKVEEKIVYKDRIKWKEKIVYKDKPAEEYNDLRDKVNILMEVNKESAKRIRQLERIIEKHTREGTWDIEPTKAEIKKITKDLHIFIDD